MKNELNNDIKEKSSSFKIDLKSLKKIKILDILLILAIFMTVGIFGLIVINKVFFKEAKSNVVYYKITFDSNDGENNSILDVRKGYIDLPTNLQKEGYEFDGWFVDGELVEGRYYVEKNTVFEAQWRLIIDDQEQNEVVFYTVTFDLNGGGDNLTERIVSGEKVIQPADPSRKGYTFKGWYYKGIEYDFNFAITEDTTIMAQWIKDEEEVVYHTVTFDLNGGGNKYTKKVSSGKKIAKPNNPIRSGYTFNGWAYDGKSYNFDNAVKKDITLVAQWTENKVEVIYHTVTFDLNGGGDSYTKKIVSGEKIVRPTNPTRDNYVFSGWSYNGQSYNFNNNVTNDITLVAQWTKTYKVTFVLNNGKSSVQKIVESGNKVNKIENPTKQGYTFVTWYTEKSVAYNFDSEVNEDITLYAKWKPSNGVNAIKNMTYIGVNNPQTINNNKFLADKELGNKLLVKTSFSTNAEIYYSHIISGQLVNKTFYAIRIYNDNTQNVTIKINSCGAVMGKDTNTLWNQYYNKKCNIVGKTYTIKPQTSLVIFHNRNSFVDKNDVMNQSGVNPLSGPFEGVLNISTTGKVLISSFAFKNIANTYEAKE